MCDQEQGASKTASEERRICKRWDTLYAEGNFGQPKGGVPRDLPQVLLVNAQWLVVFIGILGFIVAAPPGQRFPRRLGGWVRLGLMILGLVILVLGGWIVYALPALRLIPPEEMA